jgi:TatD DNase family protein
MTWLYDSHIHFSDPEYDFEMPNIIRLMENLQIKACCVSMDYDTSKKTLELASKSNLILPFLGIHPELAQKKPDPVLELIKKNSNKVIGIGEIGLDKTYTSTENDFKKQE